MRTLEQDLKLIKDIYLSVINDIEFEDKEDEYILFSSLYDTTFSIYEIEWASGENDLYKIIDCVDSHGGEGEGEDYWSISKLIIKKTGEEIYVKFHGYYSSWAGVEWDGIEIVEPKEVVVTKYFNKEY